MMLTRTGSRPALGALGLVLLALTCHVGAAHASPPAYAPGRVLVRFAPAPPGCTLELPLCWPEAQAALADAGLAELERLHDPKRARTLRRDLPHPETPLRRVWLAHVDPARDLGALVKRLGATPGVELASPDWLGQGAGAPPPDDPHFAEQWGAEQHSDADIDLLDAWQYVTGKPRVVIAVLDTGLDPTHRDFAPERVLPGYDFVNRDADPRDDLGHGTHVTGIAAAGAGDGVGVAGVCPSCSIMPIKVLDQYNLGSYSWWIAGIAYAVDNGAHVINLSAGGMKNDPLLHDAVRYAHDNGVIVVTAMMNFDNSMTYYPAAWPEAIAVGATDHLDQRASPFDFGGGSNYGEHVELVAPGNGIFGSLIDSVDGAVALSGTSQAAPQVSGTIGLLLTLDPELGFDTVRAILQASAEDLRGRPTEDVPGFDPHHGWGRLNAAQAMRVLLQPRDLDGDGHAADIDCDDHSETTFPGASEVPGNGRDDDCDPGTPDATATDDVELADPASDVADDGMAQLDGEPGGGGCCATLPAPTGSPHLPAAWLAGLLTLGLAVRLRRPRQRR